MPNPHQSRRKAPARRRESPRRPRTDTARPAAPPAPEQVATELPYVDDPAALAAAEAPIAYIPPDEPLRRTASARSERQRRRPAAQRKVEPPPLSRAEEFAFIRADLRRLLITAGPLLILMIALLFVIDR